MKKLLALFFFFTLLLFRSFTLALAAEPTSVPQSTTPPKGVGANTAVYLGQITNQDIDKVYQMNGYQPGGTITALIGPSDVNNSNFQNLANYAAERGIMFQLITYGQPAASGTTNLINQALGAINQNPKALVRNISLTIENEVNDPVQTQFRGSISDYYSYAYSLLSSVYSSPNGSAVIGMLSNLNITHPGGVSGGIAARDWYQQLASVDRLRQEGTPSIFRLIRALASNAYPISPAYNPNGNIPGVLSFLSDQLILQELGIDISSLPVYVLETGLQPGWVGQYGNNQEEFIRMFAEIWKNEGRIVSINFFNALGKNPDWKFFSLSNNLPAVMALFALIKEGVVTVQLANFIPIDLSKLVKCLDSNGTLIGYALTQDDCKKLQLSGSGQTFGTCGAEQQFPGGVETKGESFIYQANCLTSAQGAVDAVIKTLKLDLANNQNIADELKEPLDKLKPYNYNPLISEKTALGKITFDVCEEGTTNWYAVEKEVEFMTPAWVEKMKTEGNELASWLAPGGGQGSSTLGEQTTNPPAGEAGSQSLAANVVPPATQEAGSLPHGCKYWYGQNASDPTDCSCMNDVKANGEPNCRGEHSGPGNGCCPPHGFWGICGWTDCQPQDPKRCVPDDLKVVCPAWIVGGGPQPTPTPKICKRYTPEGDTVAPEAVCVGGNCLIKGISLLQQIQQVIGGVLTSVCKGKTFIITPKVQTPFVQDADTFLRQQTLSIFKVSGAEAEKAFKFEHALENAQHQTESSPPTSSETEIYGQSGVNKSYKWVQDALTPAGY